MRQQELKLRKRQGPYLHIYTYICFAGVLRRRDGASFLLGRKGVEAHEIEMEDERERERAYVARQRLDVRRTVLLQWSNMVEEKMVSSGQWEASL